MQQVSKHLGYNCSVESTTEFMLSYEYVFLPDLGNLRIALFFCLSLVSIALRIVNLDATPRFGYNSRRF